MSERSHLLSRSIPSPSRMARWALTAGFIAQAGVITAVSLVDDLRKRRNPPLDTFPRTAPVTEKVKNSRITLYNYGADVYQQMLADIHAAKKTVFFETFIWKKDRTGWAFRDALIEAAARGVDVYLVIDTWGNLNQDPRFRYFPPMEHLHVLRFPLLRPGMLTLNPRKTGRDHRKILTVDGEIAYVGGYNIGDLYATKWRDTHVRIEGPAAWELENAFIDFWNDNRRRSLPSLPDIGARSWDASIRAIQNSPSRLIFPVRSLYLEAIDRASDHLWITMGYFIPDREILSALITAAKRGVDVRVLIPEYSNHILADWCARPYYSELLENGVQLWLFQDAMVHAKTMTVDGRWSTVGTTNIDRLSLTGNFEINVEIFSRKLARAMEDAFRVDLTNSRRLELSEWNRRSTLARIAERVLRPLGPLI